MLRRIFGLPEEGRRMVEPLTKMKKWVMWMLGTKTNAYKILVSKTLETL
jgi:hypothetical protein